MMKALRFYHSTGVSKKNAMMRGYDDVISESDLKTIPGQLYLDNLL
jgi:hypothetical protein